MTTRISPPRRSLRSTTAVLLVVAGAFFAAPARAIDWCHDYTQSTITGSDSKGVSQSDLRGALDAGGYEAHNVGNIPPGEVDKRLQPGDVVIFGAAHSGVVGKDGKITHYIQRRDSEGNIISVAPGKIKKQPTFKKNTFDEIRNFTRVIDGRTVQPYNKSNIQIFRPTRKIDRAARERMREAIQTRIRAASQQVARDAARTAVRSGGKPPVPHAHHRRSRPKR